MVNCGKLLVLLCLGQFVSVLIAGTGIFSTYLSDAGFDAPSFQNLFNYALLFVVYSCVFIGRKLTGYSVPGTPNDPEKQGFIYLYGQLQVPLYLYFLCSLGDVGGNVLLVTAYQYTSLTSVTALDCFTIPTVLFLSKFVLKTRYASWQYVGVVICLGGIGMIIGSDILAKNADPADVGPNPVLGDMLTIIGACCYAASNVMQEKLVKAYDVVEYLMMMGACGLVYTCVLVSIMEREKVSSIEWTPSIGGYLFGFTAVLFMMYSLTSLFMNLFDALVFNLSLLTSDVWAILFSILVFHHDHLSWLYFVGFTFVVVGVLLYSLRAEWYAPPERHPSLPEYDIKTDLEKIEPQVEIETTD
uniref:Uncharacterized protein n=1 Tax=Mucochytrium quahogii TaxID=96639 RepID=A0A7S2W7V9_9STRA|mmetsp:Transcript_15966/g.26086  ORF Transcript_15966/g.26086 Transcript_15966/m.26086 type:complete len:357 (-) Transcript_15966:3270-4340(-)|eukprot:CAMPEP_0203778028 /NCGR_PEP_ID=MMETSP0099_2-20121227/7744_1 /ASSEMBLY_ACC=CAM_ASM_000209 /TAXON_ID=96639 /ORGANISM=" , Strain NY0313808BC1" /LENGTH=356 /DNA_ID=CAMNT_0050677441 /DNA_START=33 /DNA_END=1103 /DNA_ORIENTATION=-